LGGPPPLTEAIAAMLSDVLCGTDVTSFVEARIAAGAGQEWHYDQ
jgi:hypothetical protein